MNRCRHRKCCVVLDRIRNYSTLDQALGIIILIWFQLTNVVRYFLRTRRVEEKLYMICMFFCFSCHGGLKRTSILNNSFLKIRVLGFKTAVILFSKDDFSISIWISEFELTGFSDTFNDSNNPGEVMVTGKSLMIKTQINQSLIRYVKLLVVIVLKMCWKKLNLSWYLTIDIWLVH